MSHSAYVFAQNSSIKINIQSIQTDKGHILIAVYNKAKGFPESSEHAIQKAKLKAVRGDRSLTLQGIEPGQYAIAVFHDANDDGRMNKNMLGIPKEGYGVSNNVKNLMSAPAFNDAMFHHKNFTELSIQLHY